MYARADPGYGMGSHAIADGTVPEEREPATRIKEQLLLLFRSPGYKPPLLPAVALELIELSRKPRVQVAELVGLLSRDPMLAAQLLRIAASPVYSRGEPVRSLNDAVVRLGLTRTADLFVRAALESRLLKAPGFDSVMVKLRGHSAFTAEVARLVSDHAVGFGDYAFLCGLLHDMGVAAALLALSEQVKPPSNPDPALLWQALHDIHESSSEALANVWGLPREMSLVLGLHHRLGDQKHVHPLAAAVSLADHLAEEAGFGLFGECEAAETDAVARLLGIDARTLAKLRESVASLASTFRA